MAHGHTAAAGRERAPSADEILSRLSGRSVRCYHCGGWFRAAARAITSSCPTCYGQVHVPDVHVRESHLTGPVLSAGCVTVHRRATVRAKVVAACHGVTVQGRLEGDIVCGGPVVIGREAVFRGSILARSLEVQAGAVLVGGRVEVPFEPIGRVVLPRGGAGGIAAAVRGE